MVDTKPHLSFPSNNQHGRTSIKIECPFCGSCVEAFVWSLAGTGKKCDSCKDTICYTCISVKRG